MASTRRPLVNVSGVISELPIGDTVAGAGSGSPEVHTGSSAPTGSEQIWIDPTLPVGSTLLTPPWVTGCWVMVCALGHNATTTLNNNTTTQWFVMLDLPARLSYSAVSAFCTTAQPGGSLVLEMYAPYSSSNPLPGAYVGLLASLSAVTTGEVTQTIDGEMPYGKFWLSARKAGSGGGAWSATQTAPTGFVVDHQANAVTAFPVAQYGPGYVAREYSYAAGDYPGTAPTGGFETLSSFPAVSVKVV